jgi:glycosyltransferase involved in cell wall biosynthesis
LRAPQASIVYVTHRPNPRFEWFADSLANQLVDGSEVEVIVVDAHHSPARERQFALCVDGRFALRHVAPKPSPYSGPHRATSRDHSAISNARNTGIVYSRAPYVVFNDDSGVLVEGWWEEVKRAADLGYVIGGSYENRLEMQVSEGRLEHPAPRANALNLIDSRWGLGDDQALVQFTGGQLFGCGLGAPRELLVAVNGFDELCDPIGGEDANLGLRLEWSGARLFYSRRMRMVKDGARHRDDVVVRLDRSLDERRYMAVLESFGVRERKFADGRLDCGYLCLDLLFGTRMLRSLGNNYDLAELTEADLEGTARDFPERYWATGEPLAAL